MKADFSGYATKTGVLCSDGRTIMPDAFKHQDNARVPLVWQHGHSNPENVLGHAILENRPDGVFCHGFFNNSAKAQHTRELLEHGDINSLSIWANQLIERTKKVLHGAIREVSLVLSGANPGALIENVTIRHSDDDEVTTLDDEVIIYTGLELEHSDDTKENEDMGANQKVYETMTDEQKEMFHKVLGAALVHSDKGVDKDTSDKDFLKKILNDAVVHVDGDTKDDNPDDPTIEEIYNSMDDQQKEVLHFMIGQALESAGSMKQDNTDSEKDQTAEHGETEKEGSTKMTRNVFEDKGDKVAADVLSHSDMLGILETAKRGSLSDAVEQYALAHNITDIDQLFPDARALDGTPEWNSRRTEWVADLLGAARKSPFSRIRTVQADITMDDARAKGYVTGALKKEEFFTVARRTTTPTTIYKKQALDRDDVVDITDFDVVVWLKGEMRLMLDEEIGRAILIGDGRDVSSKDKINEGNIRPIATDHELYTTVVNVNIDDSLSTMNEVLDAVITNRSKLKGTGTPNFYTTEYWIARFLLLRDGDNRRMFRNLEELAMELRVGKIIPVEAMQEDDDIIGIMVNPVDYVIGADKGGQVSMFDDFDIDYNKQKYLIETRLSGALTRLKSALVIKRVTGTDVLASPAVPTFDAETGALTIVNTTGVVYKHGVTTVNAGGSPYTVPSGETWVIDATPAAGYYFATSDDDQWSFTAD